MYRKVYLEFPGIGLTFFGIFFFISFIGMFGPRKLYLLGILLLLGSVIGVRISWHYFKNPPVLLQLTPTEFIWEFNKIPWEYIMGGGATMVGGNPYLPVENAPYIGVKLTREGRRKYLNAGDKVFSKFTHIYNKITSLGQSRRKSYDIMIYMVSLDIKAKTLVTMINERAKGSRFSFKKYPRLYSIRLLQKTMMMIYFL